MNVALGVALCVAAAVGGPHAAGSTPTTPTLSATSTDGAINLTLSGHATDWWFRIESGTCTAVRGSNTVSNIRGYAAGNYTIRAFSGSLCTAQLAQTTVTVTPPYSTATLTAVVNNGAIDLTLANGPDDWWFRIDWGTCTAVSGAAVRNIQGYAPNVYSVRAFTDSECYTQFAETTVSVPEPIFPSATLTATVQNDWSVDLTLANGPNQWWFRIGGGTCTAVVGTGVSNIRGYRSNGYQVVAYRDQDCHQFLAQANFIIPTATLSATVDSEDESVDIALSNGPDNWWFIIGGGGQPAGTCTAAGGTKVEGISGYAPGAYTVAAYLNERCGHLIARGNFTISRSNQTYTLSHIVRGGSVNLQTNPGQHAWYYKIDGGPSSVDCTFSGALIATVWGLGSGSYNASSYSDSDGSCSTLQASTTFSMP